MLGQSGTVRGEPISPLIIPAETAIPNISEIAPVQNSYSCISDDQRENDEFQLNNAIFIVKWGGPGTGVGQFNSPTGIAVDSSAKVYAADLRNYRIQKFDSNGNFLAKWGTQGAGEGLFELPSGIDVDSAGNVYVADTGNNRIQKFEQTFRIKGVVKEANGTPMSDELITLIGDASEAVSTDSNGKYRFNLIDDGNYTITPDKKGFTLIPAIITRDISGSSVKGQKFIGKKN